MKKSNLATYLSVIALVFSIAIALLYFKNATKTGYVILSEVFDEFGLKKDLETQYTATRNARKKILDSLQIDLSILQKRIQTSQADENEKNLFERKKIEYQQKMQLFDEENVQLTKQFDEQIIKQLNQYISDFGKEKKYDVILGNTNGSIMYGTEKLNVTKEVIIYINEKYKGVK